MKKVTVNGKFFVSETLFSHIAIQTFTPRFKMNVSIKERKKKKLKVKTVI